VITHLGTLGTF